MGLEHQMSQGAFPLGGLRRRSVRMRLSLAAFNEGCGRSPSPPSLVSDAGAAATTTP